GVATGARSRAALRQSFSRQSASSSRRGHRSRSCRCGFDAIMPPLSSSQQPANGATMRLTITALVCVFGTILAPRPATAVDFPTTPVHVIVPFTAGGAPDVLMRLLGQKLAEKWGQGVVIENRAGGNTLIGTVAGAKSAPDGYTRTLAADQTFVLNPLLYSSLPYSMKEFDPIILMASIPHML